MDNRIQIDRLTKEDFIQILNSVLEEKLKPLISDSKEKSYNVQELSKLFRVSNLTIYNYIKRGVIPAKKVGRKYLILDSEIKHILSDVKSLKYKRDK